MEPGWIVDKLTDNRVNINCQNYLQFSKLALAVTKDFITPLAVTRPYTNDGGICMVRAVIMITTKRFAKHIKNQRNEKSYVHINLKLFTT